MEFSWHLYDQNPATYSENESDGSHAGGSHDFGTVGDQVEQDGYGGLGRVVEAAAQHWRQVAGGVKGERSVTVQSWPHSNTTAKKKSFLFLTPEWCRPRGPPASAGPWRRVWTQPPLAAAAAGSRRIQQRRPKGASEPFSAGGEE